MPPHAMSTMEMEEFPEAPKKNLTIAINYEVSLVDEFVSTSRNHRRVGNPVEAVPGTTAAYPPTISQPDFNRKDSNLENSAPNVEAANKRRSSMFSPDSIRRSGRDRQGKRDVSLARTQVKYDMQMVPSVRKNKAFLDAFPLWWMSRTESKTTSIRRSSRLAAPPMDSCCCSKVEETMSPFEDDSSLIWIPNGRRDWEDSVAEMTAVCTSAGLHRYNAQVDHQTRFQAPLSRDYIRDRVDIDDPLNGYQIRHREGGWLQGFLLWTNFTTWTHFFKWDSLHSQSGIQSTAPSLVADRDGTLSSELEACSRSGDPLLGGIVFPEIAEIALVGGLGCGEYLLRMALDDIKAAKKYQYVVLQATDDSKCFYERYGFVRVGAICRYSSSTPAPGNENPVVGYRHWTHPNESDVSLQLHGGPSYMMCLKLPQLCQTCFSPNCGIAADNSFLETMLAMTITEQKPTIEQLGGSTPGPKPSGKSSNASVSSQTVSLNKRKPGRKPSPKSSPLRDKPTVQFALDSIPLPSPPVAKRRFSDKPAEEHNAKRRKMKSDDPSFKSPLPSTESPQEFVEVSGPSSAFQNVELRSRTPRDRDRAPSARKGATPPEKSVKPGEKRYYSVRGPDGRFIRVAIDDLDNLPTQKPPRLPVPIKPKQNTKSAPPRSKSIQKTSRSKRVNRAELKKQKVKAYPRGRLHYYNRVVKPADGSKDYYFVLHYDENKETIQIVPMEAHGACMGKQAGRPRYQCMIGETDENFRIESVHDFQVVPSTMVMKTSIVANEAWDIQDSD